jgi:hypothetical protein
VPWVETHSLSFVARHHTGDVADAEALLGRLEAFRSALADRFPVTPGEVAVVLHPTPAQLMLAAPWLPVAHVASAPAGRRYLTGSFGRAHIHTLSPRALATRASAVEGSREALELAPMHEYVHVVVGANSPGLPPPFSLGSGLRYLRLAWQCEGAATHFSGQSRRMRGAVARRLREAPVPSFPPSARDALLLGGAIYDLLEDRVGPEACTRLATRLDPAGPATALERAFERPLREIEADWREALAAAVRASGRRG